MIHLLPQTGLVGNRQTYGLALVKFESMKKLQLVYNALIIKPLENEDKVKI